MNETKPSWKSRGCIGPAIALIAQALLLMGVQVTPDEQAALNNLVLAALTAAGVITGLIGRIRAKTQIRLW